MYPPHVTRERPLEPTLFPTYQVSYTYDYWFCCGWDDSTERGLTWVGAVKRAHEIANGAIPWLIIDKEIAEDYILERREHGL